MPRHTKAERDVFRRDWLARHRGHRWSKTLPVICTFCGRKYDPNIHHPSKPYKGAWKGVCRARRKPNRWRLHERRAWNAANTTRTETPTLNAAWILSQIEDIKWQLRCQRIPIDDRFWKYHRLARRYRRLMRLWWANPTFVTFSHDDRAPSEGWITRGRNRLLARAKAEQSRVICEGDCVYTFEPSLFV